MTLAVHGPPGGREAVPVLGPQRGQRREGGSRERMLEVAVEIDGKPLSAFGCDGIVVSTPTGSTAYAFSLGGPVIWPDVEAMLMVPNAAHALFSRPIVVSPTSRLAVEVMPRRPRATGSCGATGGASWSCAGRADRGDPQRRPGPARPAQRVPVHRPAGGEVRPQRRGVARQRPLPLTGAPRG